MSNTFLAFEKFQDVLFHLGMCFTHLKLVASYSVMGLSITKKKCWRVQILTFWVKNTVPLTVSPFRTQTALVGAILLDWRPILTDSNDSGGKYVGRFWCDEPKIQLKISTLAKKVKCDLISTLHDKEEKMKSSLLDLISRIKNEETRNDL